MKGKTFGRLTAIEVDNSHTRHRKWVCQCQCGIKVSVLQYNLNNGTTKSCGCLQRERTSASTTTHGLSKTPIYHSWVNMIARCTNPKKECWHNYGGRGITVCKRWRDSFENFLSDMGNGYFPKAEIDRIDNNDGYYPENCRWVTRALNSRNTRSNVFLTHQGVTITLKEWAEKAGIKNGTLWKRIKAGWPVSVALTKPVTSRKAAV